MIHDSKQKKPNKCTSSIHYLRGTLSALTTALIPRMIIDSGGMTDISDPC